MARNVDAWKQPDFPAPLDDSQEVDELDDDSEEKRCFICFELESTARKKVFFVPCAHAACEPCVQTLRREAVCKAVKGVLCPYCRQSIENYSTTKPARQPTRKRVEDMFPAHLKNTRFVLKAERGCPKGRPRVPAPYGWQGVTSIGGLNDYSPPPNVTGSDGPGLKPNRSEENLLDNFQGLPLKPSDNLLAMAETVSGSKQLHFNLRNLTGKKQKQLLKQLMEAVIPHARRLSTHHCGNYTLQRLLGFASQHRAEQVHGECAYTALVRSLCKDKSLAEISSHEKGTFVVQKMVDCLSGSAELKLVMNSIEGKVGQMATNPNACFSLERIVEVCIVSVSRPEGRMPYAPAQEAAKYLCRIALELCATRDFSFKASQASNYVGAFILSISKWFTEQGCWFQAAPSMLIECFRWSATEVRTRALLLSLAKHADEFSALGKWGRRFLQGLMSLDIPEVAEAIVESFIGDSSKPRVGQIACLALDGKDLFYSCVAAPCLSDGHREKIVRDFMLKAQEDHHYLKNPHALQGLCFGLSLLPPAMMNEHVEILRALGSCSPSLLQTLKGMQAEYCLPQQVNSGAFGAAPLAPSNQSTNGVHASAVVPRQAPAASAENFPPLNQGPPQAQPPANGTATVTTAPKAPDQSPSDASKKPNKNVSQASSQKSSKKGKGGTKNPAGNVPGADPNVKGNVRRKLKMEATATDSTESLVLEEKSSSQQSTPEEASAMTLQASASSQDEEIASSFKPQIAAQENLATLPGGALPSVQPSVTPPPPQGISLPVTCAQCHVEPACVILLQCRHLSSCKGCATGLKFCPLCSALVVESFEVTAIPGSNSNTDKSMQIKPEDWSGPALVQEAPTYGQEPRRISLQPLLQNGYPSQNGNQAGNQPVSLLGHVQNPRPSPMDTFVGQGMGGAGAMPGPASNPMFFPNVLPNGNAHASSAFMSSGMSSVGSFSIQNMPHLIPQGTLHSGQQMVHSRNQAGFPGEFQGMSSSQLAPSASADQFPDVNLSFLNAHHGDFGTSIQQPQQALMAPMNPANHLHPGSFGAVPAQQRPAIHPAPYLPPGLF